MADEPFRLSDARRELIYRLEGPKRAPLVLASMEGRDRTVDAEKYFTRVKGVTDPDTHKGAVSGGPGAPPQYQFMSAEEQAQYRASAGPRQEGTANIYVGSSTIVKRLPIQPTAREQELKQSQYIPTPASTQIPQQERALSSQPLLSRPAPFRPVVQPTAREQELKQSQYIPTPASTQIPQQERALSSQPLLSRPAPFRPVTTSRAEVLGALQEGAFSGKRPYSAEELTSLGFVASSASINGKTVYALPEGADYTRSFSPVTQETINRAHQPKGGVYGAPYVAVSPFSQYSGPQEVNAVDARVAVYEEKYWNASFLERSDYYSYALVAKPTDVLGAQLYGLVSGDYKPVVREIALAQAKLDVIRSKRRLERSKAFESGDYFRGVIGVELDNLDSTLERAYESAPGQMLLYLSGGKVLGMAVKAAPVIESAIGASKLGRAVAPVVSFGGKIISPVVAASKGVGRFLSPVITPALENPVASITVLSGGGSYVDARLQDASETESRLAGSKGIVRGYVAGKLMGYGYAAGARAIAPKAPPGISPTVDVSEVISVRYPSGAERLYYRGDVTQDAIVTGGLGVRTTRPIGGTVEGVLYRQAPDLPFRGLGKFTGLRTEELTVAGLGLKGAQMRVTPLSARVVVSGESAAPAVVETISNRKLFLDIYPKNVARSSAIVMTLLPETTLGEGVGYAGERLYRFSNRAVTLGESVSPVEVTALGRVYSYQVKTTNIAVDYALRGPKIKPQTGKFNVRVRTPDVLTEFGAEPPSLPSAPSDLALPRALSRGGRGPVLKAGAGDVNVLFDRPSLGRNPMSRGPLAPRGPNVVETGGSGGTTLKQLIRDAERQGVVVRQVPVSADVDVAVKRAVSSSLRGIAGGTSGVSRDSLLGSALVLSARQGLRSGERTVQLPSTRVTELAGLRTAQLPPTRVTKLTGLRTAQLPSIHRADLDVPRTAEIQLPRMASLQPPRIVELEVPRTVELEVPRTIEIEPPTPVIIEPPTPVIIEPPPFIIPPFIPSFGGGGGGNRRESGAGTRAPAGYTPSLFGLLSDRTTSEIPSFFTGVEVRLPLAPPKPLKRRRTTKSKSRRRK